MPIRQFDEQIQFTEAFISAIQDTRDPRFSTQCIASLLRQRVSGVLADYGDQNDHDTLRSDPIFKLIAGRLPEDRNLASQPTLSRFENAVTIPDLWRLRDAMVDQFIASFESPPTDDALFRVKCWKTNSWPLCPAHDNCTNSAPSSKP